VAIGRGGILGGFGVGFIGKPANFYLHVAKKWGVPMTVIGIDPGLSGGLAVLDGANAPALLIMPTMGTERPQIDEAALRTWLEDLLLQARQRSQALTAYVESVSAMPKQGVASMFTFGCGYGLVRGILCGLRIPYRLVKPQEWQRVVLAGLDRRDPKAAAYLFASRAWPTVDWRATPNCRKPHSGLVDAAVIAEFGRRQHAG